MNSNLELNENQSEEIRSDNVKDNEVKVIRTDENAKDGQNKCPMCGGTDISVNANTGKLRCNYCRHQFEAEKSEDFETDIENLQGEIVGSGTSDIQEEVETVITLKCSSCGSEVVINTDQTTRARCHWCRSTLSINTQIPNGAVPDMVLPFNMKKDEAQGLIEKFVGKRKLFAHPKFKKEFTTDNILGVYFPYMIIDVNSHASLSGQGEHLTRKYTVSNGNNKKTYYDADLYSVERDFDLTIEGLTVESNAENLTDNDKTKTKNIINAIMPFDTENCVKWDSNYLKGYSSEKRDLNIEQLKPIVDTQCKDIARFKANESCEFYDRGIRWDHEELKIKGRQWKSAYLPVWLYSYQEKKKNKNLLHYVAVNARTKETMGSIPIHMPKLLGFSAIIEFLGAFLTFFTEFFEQDELFLVPGIAFFVITYFRYRNTGARHTYEKETVSRAKNIKTNDSFIKKLKKLSNSRMNGANNNSVNGKRGSVIPGLEKFSNIAEKINSKD